MFCYDQEGINNNEIDERDELECLRLKNVDESKCCTCVSMSGCSNFVDVE